MDPVLKKANRLYKQRKYAGVIRLLEPEIFSYREDYAFYRLLGFSCIYTGDWGGGARFLKRADQIKSLQPDIMQALAIADLRRGKTADAIRQILFIQEKFPTYKKAGRCLNMIRKQTSREDFPSYLRSRSIYRFLPALPLYIRPSVYILSSLVLIVGFIIFMFYTDYLEWPSPDVFVEQRAEDIVLTDLNGDILAYSGDFIYDFTAFEVEEKFKEIKDLLQDYNDNAAQKELNRLIQSNASLEVKARAMTLASYITEPTFTDLKTNYTFEEVALEPLLYQDCFVVWKGKISNLKIQSEKILFNFLVGYQDERILEGIIPAEINFAEDLTTSNSWEILGQIKNNSGIITLNVTALHPLF